LAARGADRAEVIQASARPSRGRAAEQPGEIPREGWRDILLCVKDKITQDQPSILAAGVAFYATLATILAFGVAISIYGLVTHNVERQLAMADGVIPEAVRAIIASQLAEIARWPRGSLCFAAGACFLFGLGSAYAAVRTLMISLNVMYEAQEKRGCVRGATSSPV
jgi:membrane protein